MHLMFFDESKNDNKYPSYHIGAIVVEDNRLLGVEAQANAIAQDVFGTFHLSEETEFHAAEIFHRKKNFKAWNNFDARIDVLCRLIDILNLDYIDLIDIKINCDLLSASQSPEDMAFK